MAGLAFAPAALGARARSAARRARAWLQPQISIGAREQRDQAVLLLAVAVIVAPHFEHLPLWSIVAIGATWIWRAWLTRSMRPAPGRLVMLVLLILGTGAVLLQYHGTLFGREASVNFLLLLIGLKVLEMRAHRDVMVIVLLSFFVILTQFLFDQSLLAAALMVVSVAMLFFVLLSVNLPEADISFPGKLRYLARVFLLALPLTLALFFLFPRLPTPAWHAGSDELDAGTGLSSSMSPGSINQLLRNDAIALRAKFKGRVPEQRLLYWRGPVFGLFDGRTWLPLALPRSLTTTPMEVLPSGASAIDYAVTLEPTQRHELLALEFAAVVDEVPTNLSRLTPTLELRTAAPVMSRLLYQVRSYTSFVLEPSLGETQLAQWRQLPLQYNPKTLAWAARFKESVRADPAAPGAPADLDARLVNAVLEFFHREPFRYNINAPTLGRDSIDEFLFDQRVGYCEHYAAAFVFLMRAMGVPARVVTGYQGGEVNPVDGYLTVRQSDAHAWAEAWLQHRGWVRVDPTAAVAPERIERTLRDRFTEGVGAYQRVAPWLRRMRLDREALENFWNQWVLSYSVERQRSLVALMGISPSTENIAALSLAVFAIVMALMAISALRPRAPRDPLAALVARLRSKLARAGLAVPANMGLRDMEQHLAGRLEPHGVAPMRALLAAIGAARYGRPSEAGRQAAQLRQLRTQLRRWRARPASQATQSSPSAPMSGAMDRSS